MYETPTLCIFYTAAAFFLLSYNFMSLVSQVSLVWVVDVLLIQYLDLTFRTAAGDCCQGVCAVDSCGNYITFCVRNYNSSDEGCYDNVTTGVFHTSPTALGYGNTIFAVNEDLGNTVTNPISVMSSDSWEVSMLDCGVTVCLFQCWVCLGYVWSDSCYL